MSSNSNDDFSPPSPTIIIPREVAIPTTTTTTTSSISTPAYTSHYDYSESSHYIPQPYNRTSFTRPEPPTQENSFGPPEIPPEAIVCKACIGTGSYGAVWKARCRGYEVAVKVPHTQQMDEEDIKSFKNEVLIMSKISHPNIIRFMGACTETGRLLIVTEICQGGDLANLLQDPSYTGDLKDRLKMAIDIAKGMTWLHAIDIIHGDLKPANLLVDSFGQVKITDFGFSQLKKHRTPEDDKSPVIKGSVLWMAPEKMKKQNVTEKSDVFSFAIILWEIVTMKKPYQPYKYKDVKSFCHAIGSKHERPELTPDIPLLLQKLMIDCWHPDPEHRYSFHEIVYHLNSSLVDCVILTDWAASFWKSKFLNQERVESIEWPLFLSALRSELGDYENSFFTHIKQCLVENIKEGAKTQEFVTMKNFDIAVNWFGPFFVRGPGSNIIRAINELSSYPWFHGNVSREIANACLTNQPRGTFLIRLSSTDPRKAPFSLSLPKNFHYQIQRTQEGFVIPKLQKEIVVYRSLEEFVGKNRGVFTTPCSKIPPQERYPVNHEN